MRALKLVGILAAALALIVLTLGIWIHSVGTRRLADLEQKVKALHDEVRSRDRSRPPRGKPQPGNAWDDYQKAFDDLDTDKASIKVLNAFAARDPKPDRERAIATANAHTAALDLLRQGTGRERAEFPARWEDGASMQLPGLLSSQSLANVALVRSQVLLEEGKARDAAELLLDVVHFSQDLGLNSTLLAEMIAHAVSGIALEGLRDVVASGKLTNEEVLDLDRALDSAERGMPRHGDSLLNESLWFGYQALLANGVGTAQKSDLLEGTESLALWRYGFSTRIVAADAFDRHLAAMRKAAALTLRPWAEVQRALDENDKEAKSCPNPLVALAIPSLAGMGKVGRERQAQIRILRMAARLRAGSDLPAPADPFGTTLLHQEKDGKIKIWSVGADGVDDGGSGEFRARNGKDIVLEMKK